MTVIMNTLNILGLIMLIMLTIASTIAMRGSLEKDIALWKGDYDTAYFIGSPSMDTELTRDLYVEKYGTSSKKEYYAQFTSAKGLPKGATNMFKSIRIFSVLIDVLVILMLVSSNFNSITLYLLTSLTTIYFTLNMLYYILVDSYREKHKKYKVIYFNNKVTAVWNIINSIWFLATMWLATILAIFRIFIREI